MAALSPANGMRPSHSCGNFHSSTPTGAHRSRPASSHSGIDRPLSRSSSAGALAVLTGRRDKYCLTRTVPEHIRSEFFRHSTPKSGPSGTKHTDKVCKSFPFRCHIDGAEYRAVTIRQLSVVQKYVEDHWREWKMFELDVGTISFYHVNMWVVRPVTTESNSALAEHLLESPQAPQWYVNHWWGEPILRFMNGLKHHSLVRSLTFHSTYWVCAFAKRHNSFEDDLSCVGETSFYKALLLTRFKMLLILDPISDIGGPGTPFKRTWCAFECAMCLEQANAPIEVVISCGERVELLINGLSHQDKIDDNYVAGRGLILKNQRESSFPTDVVQSLLTFTIEGTEASNDKDRTQILNCILGRDLDADPFQIHDKYDEASRRLRSFFALMFWHWALSGKNPEDKARRKASDALRQNLADAIRNDKWRQNLHMNLSGCPMTEEGAVEFMMHSIPSNLLQLKIDLKYAGITNAHLMVIVQALPSSLQALTLDLTGCEKINDDGVIAFASNLPMHLKELILGLSKTKVSLEVQDLSEEPLSMFREWASSPFKNEDLARATSRRQPISSAAQREEDRRTALQYLKNLPTRRVEPSLRRRIVEELAKPLPTFPAVCGPEKVVVGPTSPKGVSQKPAMLFSKAQKSF